MIDEQSSNLVNNTDKYEQIPRIRFALNKYNVWAFNHNTGQS